MRIYKNNRLSFFYRYKGVCYEVWRVCWPESKFHNQWVFAGNLMLTSNTYDTRKQAVQALKRVLKVEQK